MHHLLYPLHICGITSVYIFSPDHETLYATVSPSCVDCFQHLSSFLFGCCVLGERVEVEVSVFRYPANPYRGKATGAATGPITRRGAFAPSNSFARLEPTRTAEKGNQHMTGNQNTISEEELIATLADLRPVAITITPQEAQDGRIIYGWKWHESHGTNPTLLGALQAVLETAIFVSLQTLAPGQAVTEARSEGLD